ncbi:hypothetical protein [Candidatus Thiosymbion oneisti]|uniref:hypothetical protein n=1 Tax=Candidatus Thiosymbion oneisti TaxID=589554 RepID=UPI00105E630B|nr:hypothetical protein [Candidatus Thiosymbion oneisti]
MAIKDIFTHIKKNALSKIFKTFVGIILSIIFALLMWLISQISEFDGIYEGNAEDLICDNSKPDLDLLYIIHAKMNRPLFKYDYKIEAYLNIYDRPTKKPLGNASLEGSLEVSNSRAYMKYSLISKIEGESEPGKRNDGYMIFWIPTEGKLYGNFITPRPTKNQKCKILFGSISLMKVEEPSWSFSPHRKKSSGKIKETYLINTQDPSDSWNPISVEEYLDIKSKEGGLFGSDAQGRNP